MMVSDGCTRFGCEIWGPMTEAQVQGRTAAPARQSWRSLWCPKAGQGVRAGGVRFALLVGSIPDIKATGELYNVPAGLLGGWV